MKEINPHFEHIFLIGMPGSGKSTVGVLLAKSLGWEFLDTDLAIQTRQDMTLQEIVDRHGYQRLREVEAETICSINVEHTVVSTGGSAVYDHGAMEHLLQKGLAVFLDVNLAELERRVGDFSARGIAKRDDQTFEDLFDERGALYRRYAQVTLPWVDESPEETVERIVEQATRWQPE